MRVLSYLAGNCFRLNTYCFAPKFSYSESFHLILANEINRLHKCILVSRTCALIPEFVGANLFPN